MGFSVSGATGIIILGLLIALSFAFTSAANGFERVSDAREDRHERLLDQQNTAIEVANATYNGTAGELTVEVNNTGATELSVEHTSLLVDGELRTNASTDVEGDAATDVWLPGEQLTFVVETSTRPGRVKVATETGVAALETEVVVVG